MVRLRQGNSQQKQLDNRKAQSEGVKGSRGERGGREWGGLEAVQFRVSGDKSQ